MKNNENIDVRVLSIHCDSNHKGKHEDCPGAVMLRMNGIIYFRFVCTCRCHVWNQSIPK